MRSKTPFITTALIVINALVFFLTMTKKQLIDQYALIPAKVSHEPIRLLTSMFLHGSIMHLVFNMLTLWAVGTVLEKRLGAIQYLIAYFAGGLGGSLLVWKMASPNTPTVGASGAIFALFGILLILCKDNRQALIGVGTTVAINLVYTFSSPHISWQAHVGGLITGIILGLIILFVNSESDTNKSKPKNKPKYNTDLSQNQPKYKEQDRY